MLEIAVNNRGYFSSNQNTAAKVQGATGFRTRDSRVTRRDFADLILVLLVCNIFDDALVMHASASATEQDLEPCVFNRFLYPAKIGPVDGVSFEHVCKGAY